LRELEEGGILSWIAKNTSDEDIELRIILEDGGDLVTDTFYAREAVSGLTEHAARLVSLASPHIVIQKVEEEGGEWQKEGF
jgi:hypothetical protein